MDIKPIETQYKGYRFRSRLEARWAVFFDALGFEWEYEREGYQMGDLFYLPDFFFPKFVIDKPAIVEIKPEMPCSDSEEAQKIMALTKALNPNVVVFVLIGSPDPEKPPVMAHIIDGNLSGAMLGYIDSEEHGQFCIIGFNPDTLRNQVVVCPDGILNIPDDRNALELAFGRPIHEGLIKARQARFEHGERG